MRLLSLPPPVLRGREPEGAPPANRRPTRKAAVWPLAAAAFAIATCWAAGVLDVARPLRFGHDLIPAYTAGRMVLDGHGPRLYDVPTAEAVGRRVMADANLVGDPRHVRWLNPGWFAALFVPLALLPYRWALTVWAAANAAAFAAALAALLGRLPGRPRLRSAFAAAVVLSSPFLLALGHQQNTFLSLALLVGVGSAWRREDLFRAGVLAGMMAYKPQVAAAVGLTLMVAGGRRAFLGLLVGGLPMLALGEMVAPGSTAAFAREVPAAVAAFQADGGYNWGRQVTPTAFWRTALGGAGGMATALGAVTPAAVLAAVAWAARRFRQPGSGWTTDRLSYAKRSDELLALAVLALPLSAPYFMDYDLLLLAVPAAVALSAGRRPAAVAGWAAVWVAAYLNVDAVADVGVNLVPLVLAGLFVAQLRAYVGGGGRAVVEGRAVLPGPLAGAA